jgi:predicted DNA-binding protein
MYRPKKEYLVSTTAEKKSSSTKNKLLTIRTNENDYLKIKDFARFHGKTVSALMIDAVWEMIEDWEDLRACEDYAEAETSGSSDNISHEEFMKELGFR